jgi:hypothetical protein
MSSPTVSPPTPRTRYLCRLQCVCGRWSFRSLGSTLSALFQPSSTVLDAGVPLGRDLARLYGQGHKRVGGDLDRDFVDRAAGLPVSGFRPLRAPLPSLVAHSSGQGRQGAWRKREETQRGGAASGARARRRAHRGRGPAGTGRLRRKQHALIVPPPTNPRQLDRLELSLWTAGPIERDGSVRKCITQLESPADAHLHAKQREPTRRRARPLRPLGLLAFVGFPLAACSSSPSTSASQKVCSDRVQLSSAVSTVIDDLRSGNFGKAKDDVPAVSDALNSLSQSAQDLRSEESQSLSPQIDNLKETVTNLKDSTSVSDLQSGFDSLRSQLQSISNEISQALKCS